MMLLDLEKAIEIKTRKFNYQLEYLIRYFIIQITYLNVFIISFYNILYIHIVPYKNNYTLFINYEVRCSHHICIASS